MKTLRVGFVIFLLSFSAWAQSPGPLQVSVPEGWQIAFEVKFDSSFYTLTKKEGSSTLLLLSFPTVCSTVEVGTMLDMSVQQTFALRKKLSEITRKDTNSQIADTETKYVKEPLQGDGFSGEFVKLPGSTMPGLGTSIQCVAVLREGENLWSVQYTGSEEDWQQALQIIKTLKKKE